MNPYNIEISNIAKQFRSVGKFPDTFTDQKLNKAFDEPTYYSFKVEFYSNLYENLTTITNYDLIPQPLFLPYTTPDEGFSRLGSANNEGIREFIYERTQYSTLQYLRDNNEFLRENMLNEFIIKWQNMQTHFPYQFQSVSGLNALMKINPILGKRVSSESRITFTMLESLDQRVTHLLNLYRKVAWDDTYQRWVLPDIMRFFKIKIYITEFRNFHTTNFSRSTEIKNEEDLFFNALVDTMPTYVLELERCQFDIESFNFSPDSLSVAEAGEPRTVEFSVKVGNYNERYINPILNYFWHDWIVNGFTRSAEGNKMLNLSSEENNEIGYQLGGNLSLLAETNYAQNLLVKDGDFLYHKANTPFNEMKDDNRMLGFRGPGADGIWGPDEEGKDDADYLGVNPTDPNTWFGNAFKFGKAIVKNFVKDKVNEVKLANIGGRNITFGEALGALQSKNIFAVFGLARQAMSETIGRDLPSEQLSREPEANKLTDNLEYPAASSLLENELDKQFRLFLENIISSATENGVQNLELVQAANLVLNDRGVWEKIKDYSKATDILYDKFNEENIENLIKNPNALREIYESSDYVVKEIERGMIIEGPPSSVSTSRIISDSGGLINRPQTSLLTGNISSEINRSVLGSTDKNMEESSIERTLPSSQIGNNPGNSIYRGEINSTEGKIESQTILSDGNSIENEILGNLDRGEFYQSSRIGEKSIADPGISLGKDISESGIIEGERRESPIIWQGIGRPNPGEASDGDPLEVTNLMERPKI